MSTDIELPVDRTQRGPAFDFVGDASSERIAPGSTLDSNSRLGVGMANKSAAENDSFLKIDARAMPIGSVIHGAAFEFSLNVPAVGTGDYRLGFLREDGVWNERNAFVDLTNITSHGPRYTIEYLKPNDGTAYPHALDFGDQNLELGILVNDVWASDPIDWSTGHGIGTVLIGDGVGIPTVTYTEADFLTQIRVAKNHKGHTNLGVIMSQWTPGGVGNLFEPTALDGGVPAEDARIHVSFTKNPPEFLGLPLRRAFVDQAYTYRPDASPWSLGDQTAGNFLLVSYEVASGPAGMKAEGQAITWRPTLDDVGTHEVVLVATNAGGLTDTQVFDLSVSIETVAGPTSASSPLVSTGNAMAAALAELHTSLPGKLESFDAETQTATVRVMLDRRHTTLAGIESALEVPILTGVPVFIRGAGGFATTFPFKKGEEGLLVFIERDVSRWITDGQAQRPPTRRKHDLSDALFIPGLTSIPNRLGAMHSGALRIIGRTGNARSITLRNTPKVIESRSDGGLDIGDGVENVVALAAELCQLIEDLEVDDTIAWPLTADSAAIFAAIKVRILSIGV